MGIDELNIYTTTNKALINPNNNVKVIWSNATEPEKLVSLT